MKSQQIKTNIGVWCEVEAAELPPLKKNKRNPHLAVSSKSNSFHMGGQLNRLCVNPASP